MNRRNFLTTIGGFGSLTLAGCTEQTDNPSQNPTETPIPEVSDYTFETVSPDSVPDDPELTLKNGTGSLGKDVASTLTIQGTITVANGCKELGIESEPKFTDDGSTIESMIGIREDGDVCTQAIRDIGFELTIVAVSVPDTVTLSHAGQNSATHSLDVPKGE